MEQINNEVDHRKFLFKELFSSMDLTVLPDKPNKVENYG